MFHAHFTWGDTLTSVYPCNLHPTPLFTNKMGIVLSVCKASTFLGMSNLQLTEVSSML